MLPQLTEESETRLSEFAKRLFTALYEELCALDQRILVIEAELNQAFQQNALCQRIAEVEGVGPVTATAVVAAISNGTTFHNGRQVAVWLGLVPRQNSSGEKQRLSGITKRGDCYLRTLLVHGSRSVVFRACKKQDARSKWIAEKQKKLGTAKACVEQRIELCHIQPGRPTQNGHVGTFHGKFRDECLNTSWFPNLFDARRQIAA